MPGGCGRVIQRQECRRFIRRCLVHRVRNPNYEHNLLLTRWCAQHQLPWWFSQVKGEPLSWNKSLTSAPLSEPLTALRSTTLWTLSLYETAAGGGAATAGKNSRVLENPQRSFHLPVSLLFLLQRWSHTHWLHLCDPLQGWRICQLQEFR